MTLKPNDGRGRASASERPSPSGLGAWLAGLLEDFYVGLPALRRRGLEVGAALRSAACGEEVHRVLQRLRDRHTVVSLAPADSPSAASGAKAEGWGWREELERPTCFSEARSQGVLSLPVRLGVSDAGGRLRFWTTHVAAGATVGLRPGVEVTHWNGAPLAVAAETLGRRLGGAHPRACLRLGLEALPLRQLGPSDPPGEDWVVLTCREGGSRRDVRLEWACGVALDQRTATVADPARGLADGLRGDGFTAGLLRRRSRGAGSVAVVRLRTIPEPDDLDPLVGWIATGAARRPLVLDLRGDSGGSVAGAQRLAALLAGPDAPALRFQFRDSSAVRRMLARHDRWRPWAEPSGGHGDEFLAARPLEGEVDGNRRPPEPGAGPMVVLVDALTYSAAEILAALLRRSGRAVLAGPDPCTGGGGANAWSLATLRLLHPDHQIQLGAGPRGAPRRVGNRRRACEAVAAWCAARGADVVSRAVVDGGLRWSLRQADGTVLVGLLSPELGEGAVNLYRRGRSRFVTDGTVDVQLAVRRAVFRRQGRWEPLSALAVDRHVPLSRADLLEENGPLLENCLRLLPDAGALPARGRKPTPRTPPRVPGDSRRRTA